MRDQTAPGELELVREFVNTLDVEEGIDELAEPAAVDRWLDAKSIPTGGEATTEPERLRLIALREALRELMLANTERADPPKPALDVLNEQSAEARVGLEFDAAGAGLVTRCEGPDAAIARVLSAVYDAIRDGSWRRLKVCEADDCRWAFYDNSRNRSGTWCDMAECGNRAKARAFRERRGRADAR